MLTPWPRSTSIPRECASSKSVWSQVNVANVARLIEEGRMRPPGLAQVDAAKLDGRWDKEPRRLDVLHDHIDR